VLLSCEVLRCEDSQDLLASRVTPWFSFLAQLFSDETLPSDSCASTVRRPFSLTLQLTPILKPGMSPRPVDRIAMHSQDLRDLDDRKNLPRTVRPRVARRVRGCDVPGWIALRHR
jgi:hypothetical protein